MNRATLAATSLIVALGTGLGACSGDAGPTALADGPRFSTSGDGSALLSCPTSEARYAEERIGPNGGSVVLDGHRLDVPKGALDSNVVIRVTEPASEYLELEFTADGSEHHRFNEPVSITMDYSYCVDGSEDESSFEGWLIDPDTDELLENMGGSADADARTFTFPTDHFSGYALAD